MKRRLSAASFALLFLVLVLASCKSKAKQGETCGTSTDCAEGLQCLIIGIKFTCVTEDQAAKACAASSLCKSDGRCAAHSEGGNLSCQKTK